MKYTTAVFEKQLLATLQTEIAGIYREAFSPPPYNKPEAELIEFARSFPTQFDRPGYRFVGAFEETPERIFGFAYGYDIRPGMWWYENVSKAFPDLAASGWLTGSYQFVEIAVSPRAQGRGAGGRLHELLLEGVPNQRAVLSTLQADTAAHHLYQNRGWVVLAQDIFFPGVDRRYQIMGLMLKG
jgi:GNAT superfamily N-acetyltransferase